jgi:hypothetical protein
MMARECFVANGSYTRGPVRVESGESMAVKKEMGSMSLEPVGLHYAYGQQKEDG